MKNLLYLVLLIGIAIAIYFVSQQSGVGTLSENGLTDFAIEDTASIGKIIINDGGNTVVLDRGDSEIWMLDDTYRAMPHHIAVLMKTFSNTYVQSPVSKAKKAAIMKVIMGDTRKVEVFDRKGTWIKTWYVGRATETNQGTYAILETADGGRSTEPYILEMRGFRGYLTTRFHAQVKEWRWTGLFNYPQLDFKKINVETPRYPTDGYSITVQDKLAGEFTIFDHTGAPIDRPKSTVAAYLGEYKSVNVEHFDPHFTPAQEDSLIKTVPYYRITVTGKDDQTKSADIWYRKTPAATAGRMGDLTPELDPERVYVHFDNDIAMGQRLTFDRILRTVNEF